MGESAYLLLPSAGPDVVTSHRHFVPNITMGPPVLASVYKTVPNVFMDCHMMVSDPARVHFVAEARRPMELIRVLSLFAVGQGRRRRWRKELHLSYRGVE